jgi:succinate dehydrogenase / fumarate reductase flavoprotein subunit
MTRNVTVVRYNQHLEETLTKIDELDERFQNIGAPDRGAWTNQSVTFTRALADMIMMARVIARGALMRDECRGAHYKPDFEIPSPQADDPAELRREAEEWCRRFKARRTTNGSSRRWLSTTAAMKFAYEDVDTSLIPPRPRTYGLKGAEIIEQVWREMQGTQTEQAVSV